MGHMNTQPGELLLSKVFQQTQFCSIPRVQAEMIGCAIVLPLCINGKKIPPCREDCVGKHNDKEKEKSDSFIDFLIFFIV